VLPGRTIYAAMSQKERELISERTRAALAAAKARGARLGGDRVTGPPQALTAPPRLSRAVRRRSGPHTGSCWKWTDFEVGASRPCTVWRVR